MVVRVSESGQSEERDRVRKAVMDLRAEFGVERQLCPLWCTAKHVHLREID